jgi:hypothetical protein
MAGRMQTGGSAGNQKTEVGELAEVVTTLSVEQCRRRRLYRREVQAVWAAAVPPVGDSATHRNPGKGVERMPPQEADVPCNRA